VTVTVEEGNLMFGVGIDTVSRKSICIFQNSFFTYLYLSLTYKSYSHDSTYAVVNYGGALEY
jgi:hypothetical protein